MVVVASVLWGHMLFVWVVAVGRWNVLWMCAEKGVSFCCLIEIQCGKVFNYTFCIDWHRHVTWNMCLDEYITWSCMTIVQTINKVKEGSPHIVDSLLNNEVNLVINTTKTQGSIKDSYSIRRTSLMNNIPYFTTIAGAKVAVDAIENMKNHSLSVKSLQSIHWKILTLKNIRPS